MGNLPGPGINCNISRVPDPQERHVNIGMAHIAQNRPDRIRGMATAPLQDLDMAAAELDDAVGELGLHGVEICSHVDDRKFDDPSLQPFFEMAEDELAGMRGTTTAQL